MYELDHICDKSACVATLLFLVPPRSRHLNWAGLWLELRKGITFRQWRDELHTRQNDQRPEGTLVGNRMMKVKTIKVKMYKCQAHGESTQSVTMLKAHQWPLSGYGAAMSQRGVNPFYYVIKTIYRAVPTLVRSWAVHICFMKGLTFMVHGPWIMLQMFKSFFFHFVNV